MPVTPTPTLTPMPPAPKRSDGDQNYSDIADAWMDAIPGFGADIQAIGNAAQANATFAQQQAALTAADRQQTDQDRASATASAASALNAPGTNATSTTSHSISTGSKTFAIQTGKNFVLGQTAVIARQSAPTTQMQGVITAVDAGAGSITVQVDSFIGAGTHTDWIISLGAPATYERAARLPSATLTAIGPTLLSDRAVVNATPAANDVGVTLPASPVQGAQVVVRVFGVTGSYKLTVFRNGQAIGGKAEDFNCAVNGVELTFRFEGTSWAIIPRAFQP